MPKHESMQLESTSAHVRSTNAAQGSAIMALNFPNESKEYRNARDRLLERELELRKLSSDIAEERSRLPAGGVVPRDHASQLL